MVHAPLVSRRHLLNVLNGRILANLKSWQAIPGVYTRAGGQSNTATSEAEPPAVGRGSSLV
jgi:hypothetical protein